MMQGNYTVFQLLFMDLNMGSYYETYSIIYSYIFIITPYLYKYKQLTYPVGKI